MKRSKLKIREELAIRHWQQVLSLGTGKDETQKSDTKQQGKSSGFEVLP